MDFTSQDVAGIEQKRRHVIAEDIAGMNCRCRVIAGMDNRSQVIAGMEYANQVIANCFQAIQQLLSAQLSQSDARDRRTNNFTSAGAKLRTCNMTRHDNKIQDIAGMDFNTCQVITGMVYIRHDIAGMVYGVQAITVIDFCDEART